MPAPSEAPFTFHRRKLAISYVEGLLGQSAFDFGSGLFLTAPRRTGKTTFLREDLVPELRSRGVLPIYVDLWADRSADPGVLIADAIKSGFGDLESVVSKAVRGIAKIGVPGALSIDLESIGKPSGTTLTSAIEALVKRAQKIVCLIVDEAQHAVTTEAGLNAMFALKAARDALNIGPSGRRLPLVFTGSDRDKLGSLVRERRQPFFGAQILDFPLLDRRYADAFGDWVNARLARDNRFNLDDVWAAFDMLGRRPEHLRSLLTKLAFSEARAGSLHDTLAADAIGLRDRLWEDFDREFDGLTGIQQAVLRHLLIEGDKFSPFGAESLARYSALAGQKVGKSAVQAALQALRDKSLVWRSVHGVYMPEDKAMLEWHEARFGAGGSSGT
jgi:hypothetical protein